MNRLGRALLTAALVSLGLAALAFVMIDRLHDRLVFHPTAGRWLGLEQLGLDGEEVWLQSEDGVRLHAFWVRAPLPADRALLFLHGNAGNASHRLPNAGELAALGADVLLLDYRGYGLSEGRPSEAGVYADARAALSHLIEERGVPGRRVVLFGRSLGGAVAVDLARDRELAGVILESTFSSGADVARAAFTLPFAALVRDRWNSAAKIGRVRAPLLFFHGEEHR